jgi:hypothetical protein
MLAKPILALDFVHLESADAGQRPATVGDRNRDQDLMGPRRVRDPSLDCVEVASNEGGVFVP